MSKFQSINSCAGFLKDFQSFSLNFSCLLHITQQKNYILAKMYAPALKKVLHTLFRAVYSFFWSDLSYSICISTYFTFYF